MSGGPDLPLTPDDVADIVALLDGSSYQTLEIATPRFVLKIARDDAAGWTQDWRHTVAAEPVEAAVNSAKTVASDASGETGLTAVLSPLPGTFYQAPQPGAPPFVSVGDTVGPDTVVGIIETMKVMNSVLSGVAGEIVEIVAGNGEQVGPDAILMRVRPTASAE